MDISQLSIADAYVLTPHVHRDERGVFLEFYRFEALESAVGHPLSLRQGNVSVSARGVVRGIHFAAVPPGQAKYVTCMSGSVLDVVVDVRVGSSTFGQWEAVALDDVDRRAVYVSQGLGHAFMALTDGAIVSYLCSEVFTPEREFGLHPLDPDIGISWPVGVAPLLSPRDAAAPPLQEAVDQGLLPDYDDCRRFYAALRTDAQ